MWLLMKACAKASGAVDAFLVPLVVVGGRVAAGSMRVLFCACVVIVCSCRRDSVLIRLSLSISRTLERLLWNAVVVVLINFSSKTKL